MPHHRKRHRNDTPRTFPDNRIHHRILADPRPLGYRRAEPSRMDRLSDRIRRQDIRNDVTRHALHQPASRRVDDPGRRLDLEQVRIQRQDRIVDLPREHPLCQKRKERKEVMFATRKAGKGGQKPKKDPPITIRCK